MIGRYLGLPVAQWNRCPGSVKTKATVFKFFQKRMNSRTNVFKKSLFGSNEAGNCEIVGLKQKVEKALVRNAKSIVDTGLEACLTPSIEGFAKMLIDVANISIPEICLASIYISRLKYKLPQKVKGTVSFVV
jgi:hypothetical protein